jgi:hypothetical protein
MKKWTEEITGCFGLSERLKLWRDGCQEQSRLKVVLYENEFGKVENVQDEEVMDWLDSPTTDPGQMEFKKKKFV